MLKEVTQLKTLIDKTLIKDRHGFHRQIDYLKKRISNNQPIDKLFEKLVNQINESAERATRRAQLTPTITYDEQLPVSQKRENIAKAIAENQVVVIAGETGSGKTTQIPKICLELGLAQYGQIAHTQPRRLAARSVSERIAQECQVPLGDQIGYQVRFTDQSTPNTLVKLMTDGILLAETQHDRFLNKYQVIIIDEAHERSLNIDFLLGYLKQLLPKRPDLKLIITSATIDVERFSKHFNDAPVIEVSGRTFPVEVRYRPIVDVESEDEQEGDMYQGILDAVDELEMEDAKRGQIGDVLIFLSGEREIRESSLALKRANLKQTEVLPLYARLSSAEQQRIFKPTGSGRRIILATNVAETSLTVPGIRYVIDTGVARISRYSYRSKVQRLPIEPISQASANQRKGRCGRVSEGVCIRLYSEDDFLSRPEFSDPEIQRTNLAAVILQMLSLKLGDVSKFPFVDAPDNRFVKDGYNLLKELDAVDKRNYITQIGRQLSRFPVDPRVARMLIEANRSKCLKECLIIAAALSIQDPRERPADKQQAADQKHAEYRDKESDFVTLLNLWELYEEQRQSLSSNQLRTYCKKHFLNFMRMREWRDVHYQLRILCKELKFVENDSNAGYEAVHKSILSGYLSHIGQKSDEGDYKGARNRRFMLFPGSGVFKKRPKWVVSAELVETSRLYARMNAQIQPEWLEPLATNLVKKTYLEPHWSAKRGQVMAYEQVTLFGLVIIPKRRIAYGKIEPQVSHELFIREALVHGQISTKGTFLQRNNELLEEVAELEDKSRRRDIVVDEERLFQFYMERVPHEICDTASFEKWRKQQPDDALNIEKSYLMQHGAEHVTQAQFPDHLAHGSMIYPLTYRFEPGHLEDGVSILVPAPMLKQLPVGKLEWLVPGILRDKVVAVLKCLSKPIRKQLVPVPDFADGFLLSDPNKEVSLTQELIDYIYQVKRIKVNLTDFNFSQLDAHYLMNIKVVSSDETLLAQGRNWSSLVDEVGEVSEQHQPTQENDIERDDITAWDFSELPSNYILEQSGIKVTLFPTLLDMGDSVSIKLLDRADEQAWQTRKGVLKLLQLELKEQVSVVHKAVQKQLVQEIIYYSQLGNKTELLSSMTQLVFAHAFSWDDNPTNQAEFNAIKDAGRGNIGEAIDAVIPVVKEVLVRYHELNKAIKKHNQLAFAFAASDIKQQVAHLMPKGFLGEVPFTWLKQYPRFIKAMIQRLQKLQGNIQRDKQLQLQIITWQDQYEQLVASLPASIECFEEVLALKWMIQEYRVSLFAQELGTSISVSEKRWKAQMALAKESVQQ